jgi:hypothetical protein
MSGWIELGSMVTPVRPARLKYDDGGVLLFPGTDRLAVDHQLVREHPELFEPADGADGAVRKRLEQMVSRSAPVRARPRQARSEPWRLSRPSASPNVERRTGPPRLKVRLSASAGGPFATPVSSLVTTGSRSAVACSADASALGMRRSRCS